MRCYNKIGVVRGMAKSLWAKWQMNRCSRTDIAEKTRQFGGEGEK